MEQLIFDEAAHKYFVGGVEVLGVNKIIQLAGLSSYKDIDPSRLVYASTKGKYIHKATSLSDMGQLDRTTVDSSLMPFVECWEKFIQDNKIEILFNEQKMYSPKLMIAGTGDRIFRWKNKIWICDIKTGEKIKPETILQLAAYQIIANEALKLKIASRVTVRLTTTIPEIDPHDDEADIYDFLGVLRGVRFGLKHKLIKEAA